MPQLLSSILNNSSSSKTLRCEVFTSSGTWTNPGVDFAEVILVAGGGAGFYTGYSSTNGGYSYFGTLLTARYGNAASSGAQGKGGGKNLASDSQVSVGGSCTGGSGGEYDTVTPLYPEHIPGYAFHDPVVWNNGGCSYGKGAVSATTTDAEANGGGGGSSVNGAMTSAATGGGGEIVHRIVNVSGLDTVTVTIGGGGTCSHAATYTDGAAGRCEVYWWE